MGKRRHPSACKSTASPMKYLSRNEQDLSDGIQSYSMHVSEGNFEWDKMPGGKAGAALGAGAVMGAMPALAGLGPAGLLLAANEVGKIRNARAYNQGFEESHIDAMGDLSDIGFS